MTLDSLLISCGMDEIPIVKAIFEALISSFLDALVEKKIERKSIVMQMIPVSETILKMLIAYDKYEKNIREFDTIVQGMKQIFMEETKSRFNEIEKAKT